MKFLLRTATAVLVLSSTSTLSHAQEAARLEIAVDTGAQTGAVMIALYDSEASYAQGAPLRAVRLDIVGGERQAVVEGLPAGTYGIKAFHDVNGNGKMDTNPFGMPVEPYAFSNNAVGNMGPAGWDRARFTVSGTTVQTLNLR